MENPILARFLRTPGGAVRPVEEGGHRCAMKSGVRTTPMGSPDWNITLTQDEKEASGSRPHPEARHPLPGGTFFTAIDNQLFFFR